MNAIQRIRQWFKEYNEYSLTKLEYPNRSRFAKYLLVIGIIGFVLGVVIIMTAPYEVIHYSSERFQRLEPFATIASMLVLVAIVLIMSAVILYGYNEKYLFKTEV